MKIQIFKNKNLSDFKSWPIWECQPSTFNWEYSEEEHCYIIEGDVTVIENGNIVHIKKGDYVIFPKGLKCNWEVHKAIKKYYIFK
ncbi:MAG: cupin [Candidatus Marinimicrobia bacterium]|nr:cupin [Candidatus Neomarinimicrobiota bacterium]|tara:strand:+ start:13714 stop:13968 length:255 start_codon:yes stop_codon:yes gene_type:complete